MDLIKVPNTTVNLKKGKGILVHPEYPGLLSISDTLNEYNANNIAFKVGQEKMDEFSTPCVVQVS